MRQKRTIIYINFAPYENAGHILDFLKDSFSTVILFSFQFHKLNKQSGSDTCMVFRTGSVEKTYHLFRPPVTTSLTFFLLPLRSLIICVQIVYWLLKCRKRYGPYDIYFTVNAFTAWTGNILRTAGLVKKTVFWVWDYYPPTHTDKIAMLMRKIYWLFDKPAARDATKTVFLNERLETLRKQMGVLPRAIRYPVVPIGTLPEKRAKAGNARTLKLVFFGVVKKSQGLDLVFRKADELARTFGSVELSVIGSGPDIEKYKKIAKAVPMKTTFHGFVENESDISRIIAASDIGLAPYVPEKSNVSYYSDPSKIKAYLSLGVPVITTDVFSFSEEITAAKAGIVIEYEKPAQFVRAVTRIKAGKTAYRNNAYRLSRKYFYKTLYPEIFAGV